MEATLTAENEAQSTLTSSLDIHVSFAGVVMENGATITCSDAVTSANAQSAQLLVDVAACRCLLTIITYPLKQHVHIHATLSIRNLLLAVL